MIIAQNHTSACIKETTFYISNADLWGSHSLYLAHNWFYNHTCLGFWLGVSCPFSAIIHQWLRLWLLKVHGKSVSWLLTQCLLVLALFLSPLGFQSCIPLPLLRPTLLIFPSSSSLTQFLKISPKCIPLALVSLLGSTATLSASLDFLYLTVPPELQNHMRHLESLLSPQNRAFSWGFFSL